MWGEGRAGGGGGGEGEAGQGSTASPGAQPGCLGEDHMRYIHRRVQVHMHIYPDATVQDSGIRDLGFKFRAFKA